MSRPVVVALAKWVDLRSEVDPLSGHATHDARTSGFSPADEAALEVALELADGFDLDVRLLCAAPPAATAALGALGASGADEIERVDLRAGASSRVVAAALAPRCEGATIIVAGDYSLDRGSGSVPAFLAHRLGMPQALGAVSVSAHLPSHLDVVRRLDAGRREHLRCALPAVLSVEGSVRRLRRASLTAMREPERVVEVVPAHEATHAAQRHGIVGPWRPRPRDARGPAGDAAFDRIVELTGALVERTPPKRLELEPADAAAAILEELRGWGYLDGADAR